MGARSRARRARRAWLVPPLVRVLRFVRRRLQRASPFVAWRVGLALGGLFALVGLGRKTARRNAELACGRRLDRREWRRFARRYYRHLGLLIVDWLRQPLVTAATVADHVEPEGLEELRRLRREHGALICLAGHTGLWELAGHLGGIAGLDVLAVVKPSGYPDLDAWVNDMREASGGLEVMPAKGSMWTLKKALDKGRTVGINVDQEARTNVTFAPFFGVMAATVSTPAQLHLRTGAPIVVLTAYRTGRFRYRLEVFDVIEHPRTGDRDADVLAITTRINRAMEESIQRHPEQWLWSHRRWRRRPEGEAAPFERVTERRLVL